MWKTCVCYLALILLVHAPLTYKSERAAHFKHLSQHNDVRWVWSESVSSPTNPSSTTSLANLPSHPPPLPPHTIPPHTIPPILPVLSTPDPHEQQQQLHLENIGRYIQNTTLLLRHATSIAACVHRVYIQLYADFVWTPLIMIYLDGYSVMDDRIGFWDGRSEAQICSHLMSSNKYPVDRLWEREHITCQQIVFQKLNTFIEMVHVVALILMLWFIYGRICKAAEVKTLASSSMADVKLALADELRIAFSHSHAMSPSPSPSPSPPPSSSLCTSCSPPPPLVKNVDST